MNEMRYVVFDLSPGLSDYRNYLKQRFNEYWYASDGRCRQCVWFYCGLVQASYGISMAKDTCSFGLAAETASYERAGIEFGFKG